MKILRYVLTIILLIACIVFCVLAVMGHNAAWSAAAVCGCSAAVFSTVFMNHRNKNQ